MTGPGTGVLAVIALFAVAVWYRYRQGRYRHPVSALVHVVEHVHLDSTVGSAGAG